MELVGVDGFVTGFDFDDAGVVLLEVFLDAAFVEWEFGEEFEGGGEPGGLLVVLEVVCGEEAELGVDEWEV